MNDDDARVQGELDDMGRSDLQEEMDEMRAELEKCRWILKQLPLEVLVAFHKLWDVTKNEVRRR